MNRDVQDVVLQIVHQCCVVSGQFNGVVEPNLELTKLGLDSLKLVEVVFAVESRFSIQIEEETLYTLHSVNDLINAVQTCCSEAQ